MTWLTRIYRFFHGHPRPPLSRFFESVVIEPYAEGSNDCSNKAGKYAKKLLSVGFLACVIMVRRPDKTLHAVVLVDDFICDPTTGEVSNNLEDFGEFVSIVSPTQLMRDDEFSA